MPDRTGRPFGANGDARRTELVRKIARLEGELAATEAALLALGADQASGLHLVIEVVGHRAVVPAGRLRTVVPLLATHPVPGAPREVLGTFVLRGAPVIVVDLARRLGVDREPSLDAAILVLGGSRAVGVLVDRVLAVEERIDLVRGDPPRDADGPDGRWAAVHLVASLCMWRRQVLPLLDLKSLEGRFEDAPA